MFFPLSICPSLPWQAGFFLVCALWPFAGRSGESCWTLMKDNEFYLSVKNSFPGSARSRKPAGSQVRVDARQRLAQVMLTIWYVILDRDMLP
jgi:hypothetical protein